VTTTVEAQAAEGDEHAAELAQATAAVGMLLDKFGIKRVVVVDDRQRVADWSVIGNRLAATQRQELADELAIDIDLVTDAWPEAVTELPDDVRGSLVAAFEEAVAESGVDLEQADLKIIDDEAIYSVLGSLLGERELVDVDPAEWASERDRLVADATETPTLFLIDQNLGPTVREKGTGLIREALGGVSEGCRYCLFTATVEAHEEYGQWSVLAEAEDLEIGDFGLVSKHYLALGSPLGFARMLKMSLSYADVVDFRDRVATEFAAAAAAAAETAAGLNVPVLAQIVFESSDSEGVWEVETLTRILQAYFADELDARLRDPALVAAAHHVRDLALVNTGPDPSLLVEAAAIQRAEKYHSTGFNEVHYEVSNGDVFEVQSGGQTSEWVLVGQPCDLILRRKGTRSGNQSHQVLLKMVMSDDAPNNSIELRHYRDDVRTFVKLVRPFYVPTEILELCTYSDDGAARFPAGVSDEPPIFSTSGAKKRYEGVSKRLAAQLKAVGGWPREGLPEKSLSRQFPYAERPSVAASLSLDGDPLSLAYPIRRVGRLRAPLAEAVLTAFGLASSRTAEAHDLTTIVPSV
jgi:hypothetical protein